MNHASVSGARRTTFDAMKCALPTAPRSVPQMLVPIGNRFHRCQRVAGKHADGARPRRRLGRGRFVHGCPSTCSRRVRVPFPLELELNGNTVASTTPARPASGTALGSVSGRSFCRRAASQKLLIATWRAPRHMAARRSQMRASVTSSSARQCQDGVFDQ